MITIELNGSKMKTAYGGGDSSDSETGSKLVSLNSMLYSLVASYLLYCQNGANIPKEVIQIAICMNCLRGGGFQDSVFNVIM